MVQLKTIINSLLLVTASERPAESNLVSIWNRRSSFPKVVIEVQNEELEKKSAPVMLA